MLERLKTAHQSTFGNIFVQTGKQFVYIVNRPEDKRIKSG